MLLQFVQTPVILKIADLVICGKQLFLLLWWAMLDDKIHCRVLSFTENRKEPVVVVSRNEVITEPLKEVAVIIIYLELNRVIVAMDYNLLTGKTICI